MFKTDAEIIKNIIEQDSSKNIAWMKEEIGELPCVDTVFNSYGSSYIDSAVPVMAVYDLIDQLDEPEVLSREWVKSHEQQVHPDHPSNAWWVPADDLQNLLVPKQELPVIPKFVAEFLIGKEDYMLYELLDDEWLYKEHDRVAKWLYDNDELTNRQREIDLVMARDRGCVVEREQKYIVSDNSSIPLLIKNDSGEIMSYDSQIAYNNSNGTIELTEQEIKDYDERYFAFAVKVEELEE